MSRPDSPVADDAAAPPAARPAAADTASRALALRLWRDWVRGHRWRLLFALLLMGVVSATTGAYPIVIDWAYELFGARDPRAIWLIPIIVVAVTGIKALAVYAQAVTVQGVVLHVIASLQGAMFARLTEADLERVQAEPTGRLVSRLTNDVAMIREAMGRAVAGIVDLLTLVALFASMIYLDWVMTLVALALYPVAAVPIVRIGRRLRRASTATQDRMGDTTALLTESLGGARMVRTYGLEAYEQGRARAMFEGMRAALMRLVKGRARVDPVLEALGGLAVAAVIAFAGWRVAYGNGTVGEFTGFVAALLLAARHVRSIGTLNAVAQEGLAAVQRVFAVLDDRPRIIEAAGAPALAVSAGRIALDDVRFAYRAGEEVLRGVSLTVEPGQTVALVGPSGAGKTTIVNLLPRLHDVSAGAVTIDGQDVRAVTLASLRRAMALVSQDVTLFNDTVRANIAFGRLDATEEEIAAAARAAAADEFIRALPQGYRTVVGDRGHTLSGGQRQRIALARAILRDPPILLLDEATSALDAESEQRVQAALEALSRGRSTLVVAHRLATVRRADRIYVLEAGRVAEQGTHAELLAANGLYARLCQMQFFTAEGTGENEGESAPEPEPAPARQ
ncbi:MAG: ABC transporter ATP-binding protein [Alphaproteobacteria bacterium]|nr:ABC transporter ATP-binding protein [Alphaproteobacteria bacterium]